MLHLAPHISKEDDRGDRMRGERSWSGGGVWVEEGGAAVLVEEGWCAVALGKQAGE